MKLYELNRGDQFRLVEDIKTPPAHRKLTSDEVLIFHHVDGAYSFCRDRNGEIVHPAAWSQVEKVEVAS